MFFSGYTLLYNTRCTPSNHISSPDITCATPTPAWDQILKDANVDKDKDKGSDKEGSGTPKEGRSRMHRDAHVLECSALLAIPPVERVCELMQTLSSLAMELPSSGFRYGLATAASSGYMKVINLSHIITTIVIIIIIIIIIITSIVIII